MVRKITHGKKNGVGRAIWMETAGGAEKMETSIHAGRCSAYFYSDGVEPANR
jgi:hypothetical protein